MHTLAGKSERSKLPLKTGCGLEDVNNTYYKEIRYGCVDWIHVPHDGDQ
jgi:hypothetical protein